MTPAQQAALLSSLDMAFDGITRIQQSMPQLPVDPPTEYETPAQEDARREATAELDRVVRAAWKQPHTFGDILPVDECDCDNLLLTVELKLEVDPRDTAEAVKVLRLLAAELEAL